MGDSPFVKRMEGGRYRKFIFLSRFGAAPKGNFMIDERFARTELIFGEAGMQRLQSARVAVFGVGGVGGHLVQALARAGVGHITVIDDDVVSVSNINRQAVAMDSTVGRPKVEVIAEQVKDINPACEVVPLRMFYTPESAETRVQLKKRGVADHTVVYSTEEPLKVVADESNGRHAPGSVSFVPPVVGLIMAGEIIKTIAKGEA